MNNNSDFEIKNGIKCYSPDLAFYNNDFPADTFRFLYEAEETNFWFRSRNRIIQYLFDRYIGNKKADILEIGCGTGYVLKGLASAFPKYQLTGSEIHLEGIKFAKKRLTHAEFIQLDASQMPFEDRFNAVGAFDVLEHIEEDEKVMKQVYKALQANSYFFVTVPQYQWMWSSTDDLAFHKRRYSRKELKEKLREAGFEVRFISSFVFMLFPMMIISRWLKNIKTRGNPSTTDPHAELDELNLSPFLNSVFTGFMKIDEFLIKRGKALPWGGSLVAVAKK